MITILQKLESIHRTPEVAARLNFLLEECYGEFLQGEASHCVECNALELEHAMEGDLCSPCVDKTNLKKALTSMSGTDRPAMDVCLELGITPTNRFQPIVFKRSSVCMYCGAGVANDGRYLRLTKCKDCSETS